MIIVIEGKRGEGKTTLAESIVRGKNFYSLSEHELYEMKRTGIIDLINKYKPEYLIVDCIVNLKRTKRIIRKSKHFQEIKNIILISQI